MIDRYKIPKEIVINEIKISVVIEEQMCRRTGDFGQFDPMKMTIHLEKDLCPAQMKSTFIHEVVEAINNIYDMELEHHKISLLETALFGLGFLQE